MKKIFGIGIVIAMFFSVTVWGATQVQVGPQVSVAVQERALLSAPSCLDLPQVFNGEGVDLYNSEVFFMYDPVGHDIQLNGYIKNNAQGNLSNVGARVAVIQSPRGNSTDITNYSPYAYEICIPVEARIGSSLGWSLNFYAGTVVEMNVPVNFRIIIDPSSKIKETSKTNNAIICTSLIETDSAERAFLRPDINKNYMGPCYMLVNPAE